MNRRQRPRALAAGPASVAIRLRGVAGSVQQLHVSLVATLLFAGATVLPVVAYAQDQSGPASGMTSVPSPSAGPWIVVQRAIDGTFDLELVHPDGSGLQRIPGGPGNRWHPDWSPDGRLIAYDTNRASDDVAEIGLVGVDGTDDHLLLHCVDTCYGKGGPAWSPDGRAIGFDSAEGPTPDHAGDLCYIGLLDLASATETRVLPHPGCDPSDSYVRWSPDGSHFVFQRSGSAGLALFSAAIDGTDEQQLTDWGVGARPDWSPDGASIVFMGADDCDCGRQTVQLFMVQADGTNVRRLTQVIDGAADVHPRWLPDGSAIIFSRCRPTGCEVRLVSPDGADDRALPIRGPAIGHPVWQPVVGG